jgi:hypothetical protein
MAAGKAALPAPLPASSSSDKPAALLPAAPATAAPVPASSRLPFAEAITPAVMGAGPLGSNASIHATPQGRVPADDPVISASPHINFLPRGTPVAAEGLHMPAVSPAPFQYAMTGAFSL